MEGRGEKRTRDETEGEAVAPVVQASAREGMTTATDAAVRPAAVSHGYAVRTSGRWTLDSSVKEVLLEDCGGLSDMSLHDFLMKHFKKTFGVEDTSMRVFMDDPSLCVSDEAVLRRIINSSPYRQYVEEYVGAYELYKTMREGVDRPRAMGIISLHQWASAAAANEVENVGVCVRGVLNAALLSARRNEETIRVGNAPGGEEVDGVYDAVYNARWSYVVRSSEYDKKWLGMGVLRVSEGEQPHLWSEAQADTPYDSEEPWDGDVVPGVSGKLVMAVLSSQKGWPYTLFNANTSKIVSADVLRKYKDVHNAHLHIRKENVRVWHIVKKGLVEWLTGVKSVHPFIVIGTPGIGKSFATGSVLLYQLLHYPSDELKVVAYFVREKAYIFHREGRRVVYYKKQQAAVDEIECMEKRGIVGYIIFDISGNSVIIGRLPDNWGIVLISSPNVKNFHEFAKQRQDTASIYMNCYEDAEFKAALVWDRHLRVAHNQIRFEDVNLENDWKVLGKRIYMVGPLPRYVLGDGECFRRRVIDVNAALSKILDEDVNRYARHLSNKEEWYVDGTTNKTVKLVRLWKTCPEEARNEAVSTYVRERILRKSHGELRQVDNKPQ